jgi:hypothetical protein
MSEGNIDEQQSAICRKYKVVPEPPASGARVGLATQTLGRVPLHGMRIPTTPGVCGWYLWAGDGPEDAADFYKPLCIAHLATHCPLALPFLALPPGWRFLTDDSYTDVWYDPELLKQPRD